MEREIENLRGHTDRFALRVSGVTELLDGCVKKLDVTFGDCVLDQKIEKLENRVKNEQRKEKDDFDDFEEKCDQIGAESQEGAKIQSKISKTLDLLSKMLIGMNRVNTHYLLKAKELEEEQKEMKKVEIETPSITKNGGLKNRFKTKREGKLQPKIAMSGRSASKIGQKSQKVEIPNEDPQDLNPSNYTEKGPEGSSETSNHPNSQPPEITPKTPTKVVKNSIESDKEVVLNIVDPDLQPNQTKREKTIKDGQTPSPTKISAPAVTIKQNQPEMVMKTPPTNKQSTKEHLSKNQTSNQSKKSSNPTQRTKRVKIKSKKKKLKFKR